MVKSSHSSLEASQHLPNGENLISCQWKDVQGQELEKSFSTMYDYGGQNIWSPSTQVSNLDLSPKCVAFRE